MHQASTFLNMSSGFVKSGIWNHGMRTADETPLPRITYYKNNPNVLNLPSVSDVADSFSNSHRTLVRDVVLKEGEVRLDSTRGIHITRDNCLRDLRDAIDRRRDSDVAMAAWLNESDMRISCSETPDEMRRLVSIFSKRRMRADLLCATCLQRRRARAER